MALALAKEKLNYSSEQLDAFTTKIRAGDLTPILEIYEEDIKRPVKSAVTGTLLRSVFVQVQKAKVSSFMQPLLSALALILFMCARSISTKLSLASTSCSNHKN